MSTVESEVTAEPSLASILSSAEAAPARAESVTPAAAAQPAAEAAKAATANGEQQRGANGQFAKTTPETPAATKDTPAAAPAAPAQPAKTEERPDFVSAIIAERRKRQAAEARAAQPQPGQTPPAKPDFFENPEKAVDAAVAQRTAPLEGRFFEMSVKAARANREDYESAAKSFFEAGQKDARFFDALRGAEDPGELIYAMGVQLRELSDPEVNGDIVRYRTKVTAEATKTIAEREARIKALEDENASLKRQYTDLSTVGQSLNKTTSGRQTPLEQTDDDELKSLTRFGKS